MKILALVLLSLAIMAQVMIWVADVKRRGLYAQHRYLDHMSPDSHPRKMKSLWSISEIWSHRLRNVFGIGSIVIGSLAFLL